MIDKRKLGNTDLNISALGLGTVKLGRNQGVKYPESFSIPDDTQAANLIALAKDLGINLIDTAPAYGNSEERLGKLLNGQRHDWIICSKVGEEFENGQSHFDFSPKHTRLSVERSLQRLKTDYIDIVLIHSDGNDLDIINNHGTLETLSELKAKGLIKAFGMSVKTVAGGLAAAAISDCVMLTYHLNYQDEGEVVEYCREYQKGVLLKKVLASGHLCQQGSREDALQANMNFIFANKGVSSAIIGTINPEHLRANIAAAQNALKS